MAAWLALNGAVFLFLLHRSNGAQRKPRSVRPNVPAEAQPLTGASYRIKSDDDVVKFAFRWACLVRRQRRVVAIERRAIGAHILNVLAHVTEDMRMVLWRQRTHAHEFLGADLDDLNA